MIAVAALRRERAAAHIREPIFQRAGATREPWHCA